ncbi:hypothetical protein E5D57_011083 [Metarhizium anisopliae]|nr:hypothetical protein E5D57_011083 [Metarhizium anisopliae]
MLSRNLQYPIQTPPPGITPNFVNPDSNAYQVYITAGVCIPLILMFAFFRFVSIAYAHRKATVADESVSGGAFGEEAWNVVLSSFTKSQLVLFESLRENAKGSSPTKLGLLVEVVSPLAICFVKISVFILYLQLFSVLQWMRVVSITGIVVISVWHLSISIAFAVMCSPTGSSQLDFLAALVSPMCTRTRSLVVTQGVGNVVTDVFLLVLPLPVVWTLHIPLGRKLGVSSMFLVGLS